MGVARWGEKGKSFGGTTGAHRSTLEERLLCLLSGGKLDTGLYGESTPGITSEEDVLELYKRVFQAYTRERKVRTKGDSSGIGRAGCSACLDYNVGYTSWKRRMVTLVNTPFVSPLFSSSFFPPTKNISSLPSSYLSFEAAVSDRGDRRLKSIDRPARWSHALPRIFRRFLPYAKR